MLGFSDSRSFILRDLTPTLTVGLRSLGRKGHSAGPGGPGCASCQVEHQVRQAGTLVHSFALRGLHELGTNDFAAISSSAALLPSCVAYRSDSSQYAAHALHR
jgi:hypothetical protein